MLSLDALKDTMNLHAQGHLTRRSIYDEKMIHTIYDIYIIYTNIYMIIKSDYIFIDLER